MPPEKGMPEKLRVGRIPYLNLLPIFVSLEDMETSSKYEFIEGYPSELNRMLRNGELDISPSSSIEYLRDKDAYGFLRGHSISSRGAVRSILLFSRVPLENICREDIMATHQSETSVALLRIILRRFYGHDCELKVTDTPFYEAIVKHSAYLAIGDDALMAFHDAKVLDIEKPADCIAMCSLSHQVFFVYDIGDLWRRHTGFPSVYALWTYRSGLPEEKLRLIEEFSRDLEKATGTALENFEEIAARKVDGIPMDFTVSFWRGITYGLPEDCMEGLELFEKCLKEEGLLG